MLTETIVCKVAGVSFDGRQEWLALMTIDTPVKIVPEPENPYDKHALAVHAAIEGHGVKHAGFIPKELAAQIAPRLEGEGVMATAREVTGGFEYANGDRAMLGLLIAIEVPAAPPPLHRADDKPYDGEPHGVELDGDFSWADL